jgi:hypothetical protein
MTKWDIIRFIKTNIGNYKEYEHFIGSNKYVRCAYLYFYKKQNTGNIERCVKMFMEAFSVKDCEKYEDIGLRIVKKANKLTFSTNETIFEGLIDSFIINKINNVLENE